MSSRTTLLSRFIGLYLILLSLAMTTHKQATVESMIALSHSVPALFVIGLIAVAAGLAMVLAHNVWSGGVFPILVTLTGWSLLIKGALLLFLSSESVYGLLLAGIRFEQFFYLYALIVFLLGVCLTYGGFNSTVR